MQFGIQKHPFRKKNRLNISREHRQYFIDVCQIIVKLTIFPYVTDLLISGIIHLNIMNMQYLETK